jgi:hypothetical protein
MGQTLPVQAQPEAVFTHEKTVAGDGFEMSPGVQGNVTSTVRFLELSIARKLKKNEIKFCMKPHFLGKSKIGAEFQ